MDSISIFKEKLKKEFRKKTINISKNCWKLVKDKNEIELKLEKQNNKIVLIIQAVRPSTLKGISCKKVSVINRFEQIKGKNNSFYWLDYFDIEKDSKSFILDGERRFYPVPDLKSKIFYTDEEVINLTKRSLKNLK